MAIVPDEIGITQRSYLMLLLTIFLSVKYLVLIEDYLQLLTYLRGSCSIAQVKKKNCDLIRNVLGRDHQASWKRERVSSQVIFQSRHL